MFYILMFLAVAILAVLGFAVVSEDNKRKAKRIAELEKSVNLRDGAVGFWKKRFEEFKARTDALTIPPLRTDETHTWTPHDSASWRAIMLSDLGKKFIGVSKSAHYRMLQAASASQFHAAQEVHAARGFQECLKWIMLMTVPPADKNVAEQPNAESYRDSDQELADTLSRMSPK